MGITLPEFSQLTKEQRTVMRHSSNETLLVLGGPGTGKSVLALNKALTSKSKNPLILTFNKNLAKYLKAGIEDVKHQVKKTPDVLTFDSHFAKIYYGRPGAIDDEYLKDKDKFLDELYTSEKYKNKLEELFVDEGQDLPLSQHKLLSRYAQKMTIFADENQSVNDQSSTVDQICDAYNINSRKNILNLTHNHRNTKKIFALAKLFENNKRIDTEPKKEGVLKPELGNFNAKEDMFKRISTIIDNNPDKTIGIFVPYARNRAIWDYLYENINKIVNSNKLTKKRFSFSFGEDKYTNFTNNHIHLLTFNTNKGLEYDIVIIPEVNSPFFESEDEDKSSKLYVAITRAEQELYMFYVGMKNNSFLVKKIDLNSQFVKRTSF